MQKGSSAGQKAYAPEVMKRLMCTWKYMYAGRYLCVYMYNTALYAMILCQPWLVRFKPLGLQFIKALQSEATKQSVSLI